MTSEKRTDGGTTRDRAHRSPASERWLGRLWLTVADRYERYRYLDEADKESLNWHSWGTIVTHWSLVVLMTLVTLTGLSKWLGVYGPLDIGIWGGYNPAFLVHVWSGVLLAVVAFLLYPFYSIYVDGKSVLLTRKQLQEQIVIALAFLGLASYIPGYKKARRSYDAENEEWIGHHPTQTAFWYATWLFVGILTLTGFALWAALASDPAWWIAALGFMESWFAFETILRIHLVSTAIIVASVAMHAYFPLMPSNHDLLFSMIHGRLDGWRVTAENRPERQGAARSKDTLLGPLSGLARLFGTEPDIQDSLAGPETETPTEKSTAETDTTEERS
ncbi:cytochrome b/b6 domain-containing protein [Halodesulfurarchaeum sp. HSR-GB]|uniref:cytochrome b/b6 domain-containing protein n=1 Tax=Halodesulfurarchaeum sp. HSR-GB TaxID=3074077 RepID=UPI00285C873C|nr:cytochrome b/b6 domain-containing protein [Halodesulfurarchaeum sp. HSR-GB]MDR5657571.1 cytochrome b/b6 domain-containing protein [Halodesulfurarchaeum sp. HSR-GB]